MTGRSPSRERLVQSQILCLPPASSSRELMARDTRDAWDYYGPPGGGPNNLNGVNGAAALSSPLSHHSSPAIAGAASSVTPSKIIHNNHPANAYGRAAATSSIAARQSPAAIQQPHHQQQPHQQGPVQLQHHQSAKELRENFQRNATAGTGPVNFRDSRFSLLSPNASNSKMADGAGPIGPMGGSGSPLHGATPQRLFNSSQGLAFKGSPGDQRAQPQQASYPSSGQPPPMMQPSSGSIQQLHYPHYNAKLESLTHRMPNLSFEGLGHQQPQASQSPSQSVANMVSRVESSSSSAAVTGLMHVHNNFPSSPSSSSASCPLSPAATSSACSSGGPVPDKVEGPSSAHVASAAGVDKASEPNMNESVTSSTVEGQTGEAAAASSTSGATAAVGPVSPSPSAELVVQATVAAVVDAHADCDQPTNTVSYSAALDASNQLPALLQVLYCSHKESTTTPNGEGPDMKFHLSTHRSTHSTGASDVGSERAAAEGAEASAAHPSEEEHKSQRHRHSPSVKKDGDGQSNSSTKSRKESTEGNNGASPEAASLSLLGLGVDPSSLADVEEREGHACHHGMARPSLTLTAADMAAGQLTPESTDCGSLSKSSSDGDPVGVVSRKRPPTKLKSRRRNILSFPHHISVDELRLIQVNVSLCPRFSCLGFN